METEAFEGFSQDTLDFFSELEENNDKDWFESQRDRYDEAVLAPARAFVNSVGERLRVWRPEVEANPRINKSIFKIHRDTRFSKAKDPFKTQLAIVFWEGEQRMGSPSFYFQLRADAIMAGGGFYMFDKDMLQLYRDAVEDEALGLELEDIVAALEEAGAPLSGERYKRVPNGYEKDHSRAELLKFKGVHVGASFEPDERVFSAELIDALEALWEPYLPLHDWLVRVQDA